MSEKNQESQDKSVSLLDDLAHGGYLGRYYQHTPLGRGLTTKKFIIKIKALKTSDLDRYGFPSDLNIHADVDVYDENGNLLSNDGSYSFNYLIYNAVRVPEDLVALIENKSKQDQQGLVNKVE